MNDIINLLLIILLIQLISTGKKSLWLLTIINSYSSISFFMQQIYVSNCVQKKVKKVML